MINQNMSLPELMDDFRRKERLVKEMNPHGNLTAAQIEVVNDYEAEKQLFTDTANALEFTIASSPIIVNYNSVTIESLMERAECLQALRNLTNDFDKSFVISLYKNDENTLQKVDVQSDRTTSILQKLDLLASSDEFKQAYLENQNEHMTTVTVSDLTLSSAVAQSLMRQYEIETENISESTLLVVSKLYGDGENSRLNKITEKFSEAKTVETSESKEDKELVIVESNDGYVMATNATPELLKENPDLERQFSETVKNGNEIVHNEAPRQTTIDMSKVGGNVKYEQYDDIGTVEKGQGVPTYEEKVEQTETAERERHNGTETTTTTKTTTKQNYEMDR